MSQKMKGFDLPDFDLRCQVEAPLESLGVPEDYVSEISGEIVMRVDDDDDTNAPVGEKIIGKIDLVQFHLQRALLDGQDPWQVFDDLSESFKAVHETMFEPHSATLREKVADMLHVDQVANLLWIDRVLILPRYRGRGIGLAAVMRAMATLGATNGLAGLIAAPLRNLEKFEPSWAKKMKMKLFPPDSADVRSGLGRYWERAGFVQVDLYLHLLDLSRRLTPIEEVLAMLFKDRAEGGPHAD